MATNTGSCTYECSVKIDLSSLIDNIINKLGLDIDTEYEFDEDAVIIHGEGNCGYRETIFSGTREEPGEHCLELCDSIEDINVEKSVLEAIKEITGIEAEAEIDYESIRKEY